MTIPKSIISFSMAGNRSKNTKPEIVVRKILHSMGFRFRLHNKNLIGNPDIFLKKYNTVIFVHGCFWHQHNGCILAKIPKNNSDFWITKLITNVERDNLIVENLRKKDYNIGIIWECAIVNKNRTIIYTSQVKEKINGIIYGPRRIL